MSEIVLFLLMLLAHIVEDFHLQGKLADMKQRSWWYDQIEHTVRDGQFDPDCLEADMLADELHKKYRYDYIPALILHGFEWAICVSIPVLFYTGFELSSDYIFMLVLMALVHSAVDHVKCNWHLFTLVEDQLIHMAQLVILWAMALVII